MSHEWDDRVTEFEEKPTRTAVKWSVRGWVVVVVVCALALVLGAGVWALKVGTSDVKGRGDAEVIKNDARNRINAQENFEKLFADVKAADQRIDVTAAALRLKPAGDAKLETELIGQQHYCLGLVSEYNAKARSFSQQDFRAADLPHEIDQAAPTTDCKESAK